MALLQHGFAEFYPPYMESPHIELPPPDRTQHPVWKTEQPLLTALFILHLPDGRHRLATATEKLDVEGMDLERAFMHLAMRASHQIK